MRTCSWHFGQYEPPPIPAGCASSEESKTWLQYGQVQIIAQDLGHYTWDSGPRWDSISDFIRQHSKLAETSRLEGEFLRSIS